MESWWGAAPKDRASQIDATSLSARTMYGEEDVEGIRSPRSQETIGEAEPMFVGFKYMSKFQIGSECTSLLR